MYGKFSAEDKDLILVAIMLHDGFKHGAVESRYTIAEHPVVCANALQNSNYKEYLTEEQFGKIYSAIASHMGQWNTDFKTKKEIMPKPKTAMEKFVHQCDYLASRKYLEVNFEAINYEGDRI
jgi:c-di-AMP phosphodiesterase-like protein